ncbi:hypothetical protein WMY93_024428 [Mugilogobius chulae]|uniref:YEATS domain-containing protein n=1 Tax=Mugilogobius chulae TaxID=88201 RepID=A0AAW0N2Z8_9GOBI
MENQCTVQVKLELGHRAQLRKKITSEGFTHDWMVFVRGPETGDIQHFVEKVVFRLHESFPKPKRVCKEPPYKVEESGYAGFLMPIESTSRTRPSPDYPMLPTIPLSAFSDPKKTKTSHVSKSKATSKGDTERDSSSSKNRDTSSSSSKKPSDIKVKEEVKVLPKAAFKEPKLTLASKMEGMSPKGGGPGAGGGGGGGGGGTTETKATGKRPSTVDSPKPSNKKQKKGSSEGPKGSAFTGSSPRVSSSSTAGQTYEKKTSKDKGRWVKGKNDALEMKESKKLQESEESNSEDEASSKSEQSAPSSASNSSSSSDSSSDSDFEPGQKPGQGPLRSMVEEIQSEESDDDDSSSEEETPVKTNPGNSRLSLDSGRATAVMGRTVPAETPAPPPQKHGSNNNKVSGRKSPDSTFRSEKVLKKGYDKVGRAYTEELVDLHRRLMALRERNVLQQIVNLIEETGHFNVTNTTFDFDLFSLDESTVRKLQSYLEATAT